MDDNPETRRVLDLLPNSVAPGTMMAFAGLADPADRQAVIAYLRQQSTTKSP
jgi:cytochrome c2